MKLSSIGNDDMMTYVGLQKTDTDFIVYGNIPEEYTYTEWTDVCRRFCDRKSSGGILNSVGALNVIQSEGRILAYFIVEYIEVFDDFYGIGVKVYDHVLNNSYCFENSDRCLSPSLLDYINNKVDSRKCELKPYVTPPRRTKDGDILPDKIHYFILKLL